MNGIPSRRAGADTQVDVGLRNLEPVEEDPGHLVVVVLPGVAEDFVTILGGD
jgi:hypothetical protein